MKKFIKCLVFSVFVLIFFQRLSCFTINYAMLSSDANPMYLDFWPLVSQAWAKKMKIRPMLALIASEDVQVDQTYGDVIRFDPIPDIPISFQTQVIRLLCPALFPDHTFIISDIDMLPMQKDYFKRSVKGIRSDCFVVYKSGEWAAQSDVEQYPMCYNAAKGSTFAEIFQVYSREDIRRTIIEWHNLGIGWFTDQFMLYRYLNYWPKFSTHCIRLGHCVERRLDRESWNPDKQLIRSKYYIDAHLPRPYSQHKYAINIVARRMGLKVD